MDGDKVEHMFCASDAADLQGWLDALQHAGLWLRVAEAEHHLY